MARPWGYALVAAGLALLVAPAALAEEPKEPVDTTIEVSDATLAWEVSDQTNARSHNPLAINFLAAGVADPGRGGAELPARKWRATAGSVTIQKRNAAGVWRRATWAGLGTDAHGTRIGINGPFSGHRVHLAQGAGILDPGADDATLSWTGTFSVVYYAGNSIFTVTDPALEVTAGQGSLTAELGGWVSDRADPTVWQPHPPQRVSIADFTGVDVTDAGITITPRYSGVEVTGSVPQDRSGAAWGGFPQPMIDYLQELAIDQFWYSTGLSSDATKVAKDLRIGYLDQAPEEPTPSPSPTPTPTPDNPITEPPEPTPTPTPTTAPTPAAAPLAAPPAPPPVTVTATPVAAPAPVVLAATTTAAPTADVTPAAARDNHAGWWVGGVLLLAAGVLLLIPARTRNTR